MSQERPIERRDIRLEAMPFREKVQAMFDLLKDKRLDTEIFDILAKSFTGEVDEYFEDFLKGLKAARERAKEKK